MIPSAVSRNYAPVPWWEWSGVMEKNEMCHQLDMMDDAGINEFIIFAVYGLEYPAFLSQEWFEMVRFTAVEAGKRRMKFWIYDDLNWPSGGAGGKLAELHPELLIKPLSMDFIPVAAGQKVTVAAGPVWCEFLDEYNERHPANLHDLVFFNTTGRDGRLALLYPRDDSGVGLHSSGAAGASNLPGYFDALNPKSVQAWMEIIHEQYKKHLKEYFGGVIKGFFTDEPELLRGIHINAPWTAELPELFRKRYGYELCPRLGDLFYDTPDSPQLRSDYWHLVAELFAESFGKRLDSWCRENGLLCTGHALFEEPVLQMTNLACNGDIHAVQRHFSVPGCDLLGLYTVYSKEVPELFYRFASDDPEWGRNLAVTLKRTSATARYSGAKRVMCEAFGCRKWGDDLGKVRQVSDFLAVCGINMINDNTLAYTVSGFRNITGLHFYQPYWQNYRLFADYAARVCEFAASGQLKTGIAVLYPASSIMAVTRLSLYREIEEKFDAAKPLLAVCGALLKSFRDFELLFEDILLESSVSDGKLHAANAEFTTIIVPLLPVAGDKVMEKLAEFTASGGTLITVGGHQDDVQTVSTGGNYSSPVTPALRLTVAQTAEKLPEFLEKADPPLYRISGNTADTVAALRYDGSVYRMMLANLGHGRREIVLDHTLPGNVQIVSPDDGIAACLDTNRIILEENQSWLLYFSEDDTAPELPLPAALPLWSAPSAERRTIKISRWQIDERSCNTMIPETQSIRLSPHSPWYPVARSGCFRSDRELNPDIEPNYLLRGTFHIDSAVPPDLALLADASEILELFCNGQPVTEWEKYPFWDHLNRRYFLADKCVPGENTIELRGKVDKWSSPGYNLRRKIINTRRVQPIVLCGTMDVEANTIKPERCTLFPGDITAQGFPEFAGKLVISAGIDGVLPENGTISLELPGLTAECFIDGKPCGKRAWSPWKFSVPPEIAGMTQHRITLILHNTLGNLIRMYYGGEVSTHYPFPLPDRIIAESPLV